MGSKEEMLKSKTVSGVFWKFAERCAAQVVSLLVSIVLARILLPSDYSAVSIVSIFFAFCNVIISGGFNMALIQKKDTDILDYSTVLYLSLGVSVAMYAIVFFISPYIARLYDNILLIPLMRVMGFTFFVNALKAVICAYVSNTMQFKKFFLSTIGGTGASAVIGIVMALCGMGPWALVAQQMSNSIIDTAILLITTKIRFICKFSYERFKQLFKYGWKIFVASLIGIVYEEIRPLIVGVKFTTTDLAFYNKGKSFPNIINTTTNDTLSAVLFPTLSKLQGSMESMRAVTRRFMQIASYIIFPLMIGVFAVSDKFVMLVLTEKWMRAAPYIKVFSVSGMLTMIQTGNLQAIRATGRSDIILILEIVKKSLYFIVITVFMLLAKDPITLAMSTILCSILASIINAFPNKKLIGYGYGLQLRDIVPNLLLASIMGVCVYLIGLIKMNLFLGFILQILFGIVIYVLLSIVTRNKCFRYLLDNITAYVKGRTK